jgi:hypothetical protein
VNYYILRNGQKFGPYTLADLQRYVGSGDILTTDLAQSEGMQDWIPVSQVIGNISAVPTPAAPAPQSYGQMPGYAVQQAPAAASQYPPPPNLHWGLVLLLACVTCGLFSCVWMFVEASYVSKIDRNSKAMVFYGIGVPSVILGSFLMNPVLMGRAMTGIGWLVYLGGIVLTIVAHFNVKSSLEAHFNSAEPINLRLSGVMTFFFNVIYFQYHFTRINNWRRTGVLV